MDWKLRYPLACALFAAFTLIIATVNLIIDWYTFRDFYWYSDDNLRVPFGICCVVATLIYAWEVKVGIWGMRFYINAYRIQRSKKETDVELARPKKGPKIIRQIFKKKDPQKIEAQKLARHQEAVSFVTLVFQDLPVVVIDYVAFRRGPCRLFLRLFEDTFTGEMALMGAFVSALWQLISSFRLCCTCDYHPCLPKKMDRAMTDIGCCCCRFFRPMFAVFVLGFSSYVYFKFMQDDYRSDCLDQPDSKTNITLLPELTTAVFGLTSDNVLTTSA